MKTMQMRALRAATGGAAPGRQGAAPGRQGAAPGHQGAAHGRQGAAHGHQGMRNAKRMNGQAKGLSDCNTFFIYDTDESRSRLEENVRLNSLMFAYVRLCSLIRRKIFGACLADGSDHCGSPTMTLGSHFLRLTGAGEAR
jgi:hypothetical protein